MSGRRSAGSDVAADERAAAGEDAGLFRLDFPASGGPGEGGGTGDLRVRPTGGERFVPGAAGVGKSHLATALGVKAIKNGFPVHHYVLDDLIRTMRVEEARPTVAAGRGATG